MESAIAWMTRNRVAANLLMIFILLIGFVSYQNIVQEVFPETDLGLIEIQVPYPGASPAEVEEAIVLRIEEQIEGIEGIRRITSVAGENVGFVIIELNLGVDVSETLDKVKAEIDRIDTFPDEAEEPIVQERITRKQVIQLAVHGDVPERALKELANRIKDDLTALDDVSYVRINGVRNYEIAIEVSEPALRAYNLSIAEVATAVRRGSLDLPGGSIETAGEEILIRTKGQRYTGQDFRDIILRAQPNGSMLRLGDIATVQDGFEEDDLVTRFNGEPAALVEVYRTSDEQVLSLVETVKQYTAELEPNLPAGIEISIWRDDARLLQSRLDLLIKNGFLGLLLVVLALTLFLNSRLAFWVSVGLLISFMGVFAIMTYLAVSINLISLLAFILALGIVVDDAIVIGEGIYTQQQQGYAGTEGAVRGAIRLRTPVIFAVLTTIVAFSPLLFAPGVIGKIFRMIPIIVISVLALSLIESLFILPAHLSHLDPNRPASNPIARFIERIQNAVARGLRRFIEGPLERTLRFSTRHYGIVIVSAIAMFLLTVGFVAGGFIRFSFLPDIEGENVFALLEMPAGTTIEQTAQMTAYLEEKGLEAIRELEADLPDGHPPLIQNQFTSIGQQPSTQTGPQPGVQVALVESNIADVNLELSSSETREVSAEAIENLWREKVGDVPGAKSLTFQSALISLGSPIQAELSAPSAAALDAAVIAFKDSLSRYAGVFDIEDDQDQGKQEIQFTLKPQARTLGVTLDDLARQVRGAFYGFEALRIQRGRDDIKVMVRLPKAERDALADIQQFRIRTPTGTEIPLSEVATASFGFADASIQRRNRRRIVTVTAEVDEDIIPAQSVINSMKANVLPALARDYAGFKGSFEGAQREQADTFSALGRGFLIALFVMYALLAIPFKSYIQPLVVMSVIPFGFIGAVIGHLIIGMNLSILSLFGVIGLSGVVVNDSLVLIDFINEAHRNGKPMAEAIIEGGKVRFRPILLTSITTFLGVLPLILEKSLQAQFLIPMATSLGFGILFATIIVMALVPALAMLVYRVEVLFKGEKTEAVVMEPAL